MELNKAQKQWLFDNCYITAKVLDACVEPGWKNYFIKWYKWYLGGNDDYGFTSLKLVDKDDNKTISYEIGLNFQNNDYEKLLAIK